jgi:hypothetical protein
MYGPIEPNWPQDVPEEDEMRGKDREGNDATSELINKGTLTLIIHVKITISMFVSRSQFEQEALLFGNRGA